jgi:drug/metabolite transporter (DMT)-like permease
MNLYSRSEQEKGLIAIVALTLIYGLLPLFPRYLNASFDLFQQIYLRMFAGFIILLIVFHKQINFHKLLHLPLKEARWVFLRAFIYYGLGVGLYTLAILMTKVGNVVFIGSIPMTALLGFWLLKEKVTWQKIVLLILSAIGVMIIAVKSFTGTFAFGLGELFALISSFFIALGLVTRRIQSTHLTDYETAVLMVLFAGVQLFVISLLVGEPLPTKGWSFGIVGVLLASGLTVASLSFLMNYGFARVEAVLAGNITTMSTFFSILTAFIAFGEVPVLQELLGGLLIVTSAILMHRVEGKKELTRSTPPRE